MTIVSARIKTAIVLFACCVVFSTTVVGQEAPSTSQSIRVVMFNGDMAALLGHLAKSYNAAIGLELAAKQPGVLVNVNVRDATLPDVLNAITKSAPGYHWREAESSFEVFPAEGGSPFLETIVRNFRVRDVDQTEAISQLLNQPEIQNAMKAMNLKRRDAVSITTDKEVAKISLTLDGITLRQALSRIAKESGAGFWLFRSSNDGSFSIGAMTR